MSYYHIGILYINQENLNEEKDGFDSYMSIFNLIKSSYIDKKINNKGIEIVQEKWIEYMIRYYPNYLLYFFKNIDENDSVEEVKIDLKKNIPNIDGYHFLLNLLNDYQLRFDNDISTEEVMELMDYLASYGADFNKSIFRGLSFNETIKANLNKWHQVEKLVNKYPEYPKSLKIVKENITAEWQAYEIVFNTKYGAKFFPGTGVDGFIQQLVKQKDFETIDYILDKWIKFPPIKEVLDDLEKHKVSLKDLFKIEDQLFMLNLIEKLEKFNMIIRDKYYASFMNLIQ